MVSRARASAWLAVEVGVSDILAEMKMCTECRMGIRKSEVGDVSVEGKVGGGL